MSSIFRNSLHTMLSVLRYEQSEAAKMKCCTNKKAYPSCPSSSPENRKPRTGDALTDLNNGMTRTVAAKKVKKSSPSGTRGSVAT